MYTLIGSLWLDKMLKPDDINVIFNHNMFACYVSRLTSPNDLSYENTTTV